MDHRNWRAPVPLARNQPVTHFVSSFASTRSLLFQPRDDLLTGIFTTRTVELPRIDQFAFTRVATNVCRIFRFINHLNNWQVKFLSKGKVTFVMGWHRHDRTRAVTTQYIVCHPNWQLLTVDWIDDITTSEDAGFIFVFLAFNVRLLLRRLNVCFNFGACVSIDQLRNQWVLWRQCHVAGTKQGVRARGEYGDWWYILEIINRECIL